MRKKLFPACASYTGTHSVQKASAFTVSTHLKALLVAACIFLSLSLPLANAQENESWLSKGFHEDIRKYLEAEIKAPIDYLSISIDKFRSEDVFFHAITMQGEIKSIPDDEKDDFLITLPYAQDYGVIISRKDDTGRINTRTNLEQKKYITVSSGFSLEKYIISRKQKLSYNIMTDTNPFNSFSKIFKGEADFTILPSQVAERLLLDTGMMNELYVYGTPDDTVLHFNYRFAIRKSDRETFLKLNDAITNMYKNGTIYEIARKNGLSPNVIPNFDMAQAPATANLIFFFSAFALMMTVILFILSFIFSRKIQKRQTERIQDTQTVNLETLELKRQVDEYLLGKVTLTEQTMKDPYSGLFCMSYFKDRVNEEISHHNNMEQVFSIVLLKFKDITAINKKILKAAADMLQEDFNKDCICCYDGICTFEVLFPKHTQDDIQIFAESAAEHLERVTQCSFDTEVIQYGTIKHSDFMEKVFR